MESLSGLSASILNDPSLWKKLIRLIYARTLARSWSIYKRISLRKKRVIDLTNRSINEAFSELWRKIRIGEVRDGDVVLIQGYLTDFAPLIPGGVSNVPMDEWTSLIDDRVSLVKKELEKIFTNRATGLSNEFKRSKAHYSLPKNTEHQLSKFLEYWVRLLVKHGLFASRRNSRSFIETIIQMFRSEINKDFVDSLHILVGSPLPHGVLEQPNLHKIMDYRYVGLSPQIVEYGIPLLIKNNIYDSFKGNLEKHDSCIIKAAISIRHWRMPDIVGNQEINSRISTLLNEYSGGEIIGILDDETAIRGKKNPGDKPLGRIWATFKLDMGDKERCVFIPWRTLLTRNRIKESAHQITCFIDTVQEILNVSDCERIADFSYINYFGSSPSININDNKTLTIAKELFNSM